MPDNPSNFSNNSNHRNNGFSRNGRGYNGGTPLYDEAMQGAEPLDFRKLLALAGRYKWIILLFVLIGGGVAWWYVNTLLPEYKTSGTMLISESQGKSTFGEGELGDMLSSNYGIGTGSTIANELRIIQSRSLATEIARQLFEEPFTQAGELYPVLWNEYPVDSTLADTQTVINRIQRNLTAARDGQQADVINITFQSYQPEEAAHVANLAMKAYTQYSRTQNRRMATSALDFLESEEQRVSQKLGKAEDQYKNFMESQDIVSLDAQSQRLVETITDLENQRQSVRIQQATLDSAITNYRRRMNQLKPGIARMYKGTVAPRINSYQTRLAQLQTEKLMLLNKNPKLKEHADGTGPEVPSELRKLNNKITMLRNELDQLTQEALNDDEGFAALAGNSGSSIAQQINELRQQLMQARIQKNQYDAQARALDSELQRLNSRFEQLPENMVQMARIKRNLNVNEQLYLTVAQQRAEMALWKQTQSGKGRIIDQALPPALPFQPDKRRYLLFGIIAGLMLSAGFIFVREKTHTEVESVEQMRNLEVPMLAVVPDMTPIMKDKFEGLKYTKVQDRKVSTGLQTLLDSISPSAEAHRRLYTNVKFSNPDRPMRSLLVTSTNKGEGKTTLLSNLAVVMAEAGQSVAIVDCDLRRPQLHKIFGETFKPGLVDYLFDEAPLDEVIKPTIVEGVDIIPAGQRPPNPAGITQSRQLRELIEALQQQYDHVLVDSAPYGIINDPAPLMKAVDGTLMVVRFKQTRGPELRQTLDNLNHIHANVLGTVLMAYDHKKSHDYYYTGSYYYKYSYQQYYNYHEEEA